MNAIQISALIDGKVLYDPQGNQAYARAFASDLMSDVLRLSASEETVLLTGLATVQSIRTAEISGISCVIVGRGKRVTDDMVDLAGECGIALISSSLTLFELSGKLYAYGLKPVN